ncbi:hypothetical protein ACOME3_003936 [Neoechinorhynchus agilis]
MQTGLRLVQWNSCERIGTPRLYNEIVRGDIILIQETKSISNIDDLPSNFENLSNDFCFLITAPLTNHSHGFLSIVRRSLLPSRISEYSSTDLSYDIFSIFISARKFLLANVYIRPGKVHLAHNKIILRNTMESGVDLLFGDYNDPSPKWIKSITRSARSYSIIIPPCPTFTAHSSMSYLYICYWKNTCSIKPTVTSQTAIFHRARHDLIVWNFNRNILLNKNFKLSSLNISLFNASTLFCLSHNRLFSLGDINVFLAQNSIAFFTAANRSLLSQTKPKLLSSHYGRHFTS